MSLWSGTAIRLLRLLPIDGDEEGLGLLAGDGGGVDVIFNHKTSTGRVGRNKQIPDAFWPLTDNCE